MTIEIGTNSFKATEEEGSRQTPDSAVAPTEKKDQHDDTVISSARYEWIQAAAELYVFVERRGLRLVRPDGPNGHLLSEALVLDNVLLLPPGRHPREMLCDIGADSGGSHSARSAAAST
ncbi:hypothetical protein OIE62_23110 [Streptomyces scopuliridis]|uniref:Uncharacterized protein n=1 Tax=Streptomyces scopuliridis TaxID=452529 RepID=A0ACD4ZL41_9ACTN|nr:hypothetical protein [Streptomyces scopuliridis]WSB98703.1 hypothetical protein OG835_17835 [Streptomyces scopuliridis]WSC07594.1 hypothetical protein OIE62_23110 [Streptomyces scopuliridis]